MITHTQEDYLRAIYLLEEKFSRPVKSSELAKNLNLNKSTISQRLNELQQKGWITQKPYKPVLLSEKGKKIAQNLTYKHRILELFLIEILGFEEQHVHLEAHKLEHSCSNQVIVRIAGLLQNPKFCPHGRDLPPFEENLEI